MALIANLNTLSDGKTHRRSMASFLRPANNDNYIVLDAVGTGSLQFPDCTLQNGGSGAILDGLLVIGDNMSTAADFVLYLFTGEPTSQTDGGVVALVAADQPLFVATLTFTANQASGASQSVYQADVASEKAFVLDSGSRSLYGILQNTNIIWTAPVSACPIMVSIGIRSDN